MSFACAEFIDVAKQLLADHGENQPALRTAAGRAYYALYGTIRARVIERHGDCFGDRGMHKRAFRACQDSSDARLKELGKLLESLEKLRVQSDYTYNCAVSRREVLAAIPKAEYGLKLVENLQLTATQLLFDHISG